MKPARQTLLSCVALAVSLVVSCGDADDDGGLTDDVFQAEAFCVPDCAGMECGDDGCGGVCGECPTAAPVCQDGICAIACTPLCDGKECGDDGCWGSCGTCPQAAPLCQDGSCCAPDCMGKECGDDGCGGACGACPEAAPLCQDGICSPECIPDCSGKECGDDGCGGSCGECGPGYDCVELDTVACKPDCGALCAESECGSAGEDNECPCGKCDDDNPCTDDVCGAESTCHYPAIDGPCDDENPCTYSDTCVDGDCQGEVLPPGLLTGKECPCETTEDCQLYDDGDVCSGLLTCVGPGTPGGCKADPGTVLKCDDGLFCNGPEGCHPEEGCLPGYPPEVDDGVACTADYCNEPSDQVVHQPEDIACNDHNDCTIEFCDTMNGCQYTPLQEGECADGNACTVGDHCEQGVCVGLEVVCDDGNPCTDEVCELGGCASAPNNAPCDDGNPCTIGDQCSGGECAGIELPCQCLYDDDCVVFEDGDLCNGTLYCDTAALPYECMVDPQSVVDCPVPEGPDTACLGSFCDPETGECLFVPAQEGLPCEDGDLCTIGDACMDGICVSGPLILCDDGNECTADACDPLAGCVHEDSTGTPCTWDFMNCEFPGTCKTDECIPQPNCSCPDCFLCTCCGVFQLCLDNLFG